MSHSRYTFEKGRYFPGAAVKQHTVEDMVQRYRKTVIPHKRPNTIAAQRPQLAFWEAHLWHLRLSDITPPIIAEKRDLLAKTFEPSTVNRYLAMLSHMFKMAFISSLANDSLSNGLKRFSIKRRWPASGPHTDRQKSWPTSALMRLTCLRHPA